MDTAKAIAEVKRIRECVGDMEIAHSLEDKFHIAILREIANGNTNSKELAEIALETLDINFARACA